MPRISWTRVGFCLLVAFASGSANAQPAYSKLAVISENSGKLHLSANDPRPLAQALDALQAKYGWLIDYEDPQYLSKQDTSEAPVPDAKVSYPSGHRVPSGGKFEVDLGPAPAANAAPDAFKTLQLLVDSYNRSPNPGRFELRKPTREAGAESRPEFFEVVGTGARDNQGKVIQQTALFDTPISLTPQAGNFSDFVDSLCQALTDKSHIKVSLGVHPMSLDRTKINLGGKDLAARSLLSRAIASTGRRIVWRLLYDPDSSGYFLNLHLSKLP